MGGLIRQVLIFQRDVELYVAIALRSRPGRELAVGDDVFIILKIDESTLIAIINRIGLFRQSDINSALVECLIFYNSYACWNILY